MTVVGGAARAIRPSPVDQVGLFGTIRHRTWWSDIQNKPSRSRARVGFEGRSPEPGIHFRTSLVEARVSRGMAPYFALRATKGESPCNCVRRGCGALPGTGLTTSRALPADNDQRTAQPGLA